MTESKTCGYTAYEVWKATRNSLIARSLRFATSATLVPAVAITFQPNPHARFETVRVGVLNRRKGRNDLVNNVVIGKLVIDSAHEDGLLLVERTINAIVWYMMAMQDIHMSSKTITEIVHSVMRRLDLTRIKATGVATMSDLSDPKAVSKAYNAFLKS